MTYHRWSPEEIDHLETLTGDVPFAVLVKMMRRRARQEGWPVYCLGMTLEALRGARPSVPLQAAPNEATTAPPLRKMGRPSWVSVGQGSEHRAG